MQRAVMIDGFEAVVSFDDASSMYHGEFVGLNGQVSFHAADEVDLLREGRRALATFLAQCKRQGVAPKGH